MSACDTRLESTLSLWGRKSSSLRRAASPGAASAPYASLLVVARLRLLGRVALGELLHLTAGVDGGVALRSVAATDTGQTVAAANGVELGAVLGVELP